ncbi:lysine 2,3-aminomutase [Natroniella sp. ANB-PHB2]|uniref:lysine 2,3-aminomutase n=1 Tax=Natroniella sp. ANB-PHB2 TaxID=3384444 RepID=UPI0038D4CBCA
MDRNEIKEEWACTEDEWNDWRWQLENRITTVEELNSRFDLSETEAKEIRKAIEIFPMSITPYYASLINFDNKNCPIKKQAIPDKLELDNFNYEMDDPLCEDEHSPVDGLTHRYPDRVLLLITNECSMFCRHCTRKRKVGDEKQPINFSQIEKGINYIRNNPQVRDVLLSGGDPLLVDLEKLRIVINRLKEIPHVEIVRIGSRVPVVLPQRIDDSLVEMLHEVGPVWINTHFNHEQEITAESKQALDKLANAGVPLGNQTVLLRDVNDCPEIIKNLMHKLVKNRVRPYYMYQCDLSQGIEHFRTPVAKGIEIMEHLIGHTSGMAVPRYVVDAPGGGGKIPVTPNYLLSSSSRKTILRNFEGTITVYTEPEVRPHNCPPECNICEQPFNGQDEEQKKVGLERLFAEDDDVVSLRTGERSYASYDG